MTKKEFMEGLAVLGLYGFDLKAATEDKFKLKSWFEKLEKLPIEKYVAAINKLTDVKTSWFKNDITSLISTPSIAPGAMRSLNPPRSCDHLLKTIPRPS